VHGKQTIQKTLRNQQKAAHRASYKKRNYLEIGSWRFEENESGDLVITNLESGSSTILLRK
jgi:hypothetical protein